MQAMDADKTERASMHVLSAMHMHLDLEYLQ